ncbi:Mo-dependent nitrogenase C-terminal domain-containing protein [Phormidium sp. LEGE 05292]|uniref:Mo-dependent nitrogenase C-terminal domain-containing protein n=1 Tax=[Phormidium] sp. LEGE 05292 TaxID=767427 RepID=UPI00187F0185|nr:Mo-dependent nitrogenase C-terminal domain-containing protein [Phormidium sp. LEGE 05292]MBE9228245.1 Mo-dependent nitrogenase C-terminal domain-containing protein [Phormidium sp. LEGE 05292]
MLRSGTFDNSGFYSRQQFFGILVQPVSHWLASLQVKEAKLAHFLCKLIPAHCMFERDIKLLGRTLFHIPALCKLNPFYIQLVELRFRALCFLANDCGEDVSQYCR